MKNPIANVNVNYYTRYYYF